MDVVGVVSEPTKKRCKECGCEVPHWADIAAVLEEMLGVPTLAPGLAPMLRQAVDEIRKLRSRVAFDSQIVTKYNGERLEDLYRDAMQYRLDRLNCALVGL